MKEFKYVFAVARGRIFEISYYTLGSNKAPYFTTSASEFNRPRTDFNRGGQAQKDLLHGRALTFYKKWDKYHLKDLTPTLYDMLVSDIEALKFIYPHYIKTNGEDIRFSDEVAVERAYRGVTLR